MALIGFSTGALAFQDFERGLSLVRQAGLKAVELSALRESELEPLVNSFDRIDLSGMEYVSVHAPSKISSNSETRTVELLMNASRRLWPVIVHPDVIQDFDCWARLGDMLCLENNDRRKNIGQRCSDFENLFERLPSASLCLDLGHAKQVDSTMTEAYFMLKKFGDRLRQLHVSEVTAQCTHIRLSSFTVQSFSKIASYIPAGIPAIIESIVDKEQDIQREVRAVQSILQHAGTKDDFSSLACTDSLKTTEVQPVTQG